MELDVISTIYDALRILSIFARTNLNFAKLTIFMHLVKKTFNDQRFLLSERTFFNETRCFAFTLFCLNISTTYDFFFPPPGLLMQLYALLFSRTSCKFGLKACNGPLYNQELWMIYTLVQLCLDLAAMLRREKKAVSIDTHFTIPRN